MTAPLTEREQTVLDQLAAHIAARGYPPTVREIASATGYSLAGVHVVLSLLEAKGRISREPRRPRAITITTTEGDTDVAGP